MTLQQVEHHAVARRELTHQRIGRTGGELTRFTDPFKATLNSDDVATRVEATPARPTGHLQKLTPHQRPMAPVRALGEGSDHGAASRHVDASGQGLRREDNLDQSLLEQLFDQFLPGGKNTGMVGRNPAQKGIGMDAITNRLRIGLGVGLEPGADPRLLVLGDQALAAEIAHRFVATAAAENEIDRRQHVALSHLRHHETDRRRLGLRWTGGPAFAFLAFGGPPDFAIGMQPRAGLVQQGMQTFGAAEAELQRNRSVVAQHQCGGAMDLLDPVGQLPSIGDSGRQRHQLN